MPLYQFCENDWTACWTGNTKIEHEIAHSNTQTNNHALLHETEAVPESGYKIRFWTPDKNFIAFA